MVMFGKLGISAVLALFSLAASAANGDSTLERKRQHIDSFITALHQKGQFNGSIVVAQNGAILYEKSIGLANFYSKDSLKSDYLYQMASVSKSVTAAAVMLLYQQGEIDLEDKITKYLPELPHYHSIKIKHLLHHTSGIPDYIYRFNSIWKKDDYMTNDDLLSIYATKKYRISGKPGYAFNYCNTNYAFLASIVERVTDQDFDDYVRDNIFEPLGMCNSMVFNPKKNQEECRKVVGHFWNGRRYQAITNDYRNGVVGDKGVFSSAHDMMRFEQILYTNILFTDATIEKTLSKTMLNSGKESEYGCGWRIRQIDSIPVVLHYGFWNSFRTGILCFPETHTTFVILNNTTGYKSSPINNREEIIRELMTVLFPQETVPVEVIASEKEDPEENPENPEEPVRQEGEGE